MKILLVEDDETLRFLFSEQLKKLQIPDVIVLYCSDGEQGLSSMASNFDVVLLDINIPKLDGYKVASKFRFKHPEFETRVYGFTSLLTEDVLAKALISGMDDCFEKPYSVDSLALLLEKIGIAGGDCE